MDLYLLTSMCVIMAFYTTLVLIYGITGLSL